MKSNTPANAICESCTRDSGAHAGTNCNICPYVITSGRKKKKSTSSGIKHDDGKMRWDLMPWAAMGAVIKILTLGVKKYGERNWEKGMNYGRLYAACMRHLTAWFHREEKDPESGLSHLAHACCCLLFLLSYEIWGYTKWDDRPEAK